MINHQHLDIVLGTATGTVMGVSFLPTTTEASHTAILAVIGSVVGFFVTVGCKAALKYVIKQISKRHEG